MLEIPAYSAAYSPVVQRYFKKVRDRGLKAEFMKARNDALLHPTSGSVKSADLAGVYTRSFCYAGTQFRIAYRIFDSERTVYFILAGPRECFYSDLKRYLKESKLLS